MAKKPKPELKRRIRSKGSDVLDFLTSLGQGSTAPASADDLSAITGDNSGLPSVVGGTARDFDLEALFEEVKKDLGAMPRDLKFDDSSMPCAANFYEWCTGRDFLAAEPYLEQVLIGVRLFSEYCPHCSNTNWMQIENHEPQEGLAGLRRNVVLLRNGVCPKCGAKRSALMSQKKLPVYNELGVLAGQRCVTGDTRLVTSAGIIKFRKLVDKVGHSKNPNAPHMHNSMQSARPNMFYKASNQKLHRLILANGYVLNATSSHHVGTENGQLPLSHITVGNKVRIQRGQHMYGSYCFGGSQELSINDTLDAAFYFSAGECVSVYQHPKLAEHISQLSVRCTEYSNEVAADFFDGDSLGVAVMSASMYEQKEFLRGVFSGGPFVTVGREIAYDLYAIASNMGITVSMQGNSDRVTVSCFDLTPRPLHEVLVDVVACEPTQETADVYDVHMPLGNQYIADGIKHHNSGKSIVVAMLSTYMTHRILKMQRPTKVYNVGDNQLLHGTFVALTKDQAKDTLWEPYYGYLLESPWFQRYHALIKRYEGIYGIDVMKIRDTFVLYRHRNLIVYFAGPDKRVLRGRCVTGSTIVNTDQGFLHFDEMVKGEHGFKEAHNLTVDSHRGNRKVSHTYKDRSPTIKAVTRNGYEIEGTPEHPMLVLTRDLKLEWRRLDEMRVGDRIVSRTAKSSPIYGKQKVDMDAATIAGYLVANGSRSTISSDDPVVVKTLSEAFTRLTGYCIQTAAGVQGIRAATHSLSIEGNRRKGGFISNYMHPLGYTEVGAAHKSIPVGIRGASQDVLHEFLEAYFQCDSGINGGSTASSSSNAPCEIEVGSASKKLAHQLHVILLQAYGIVGRLSKQVFYDKLDRQTGRFDSKRVHYCITITGGDAWKFLRTFKRAKVQKYADRFADTPLGYCSDRRSVPYVREFVYATFEAARKVDSSAKRLRKFVARDGSEFSWPNSAKPRAFKHIRSGHDLSTLDTPEYLIYQDSWEPMLELMAKADPKAASRVRKLIKLGAHFEEVTHIKHGSKVKTVYDITVPNGHAFTANGLASHNTRIFYAIDEIGWFDNDAAKNSIKTGAKEVSIALERSCLTVRAAEHRLIKSGLDDFLSAYGFNVSSPSDYRDKICEIVRQSKTSNKILGIHAPTWKMNPNITRETLDEEYRKDPVAAARDYGAEPPVSANPFITPQTVDTCRREGSPNGVKYTEHVERSRGVIANSVDRTRYGRVTKIRKGERPSILAMDAGETNNSFALACGSMHEGKPRIDLLIEIMPMPGIPLNYTLIFDHVIARVCKERNVKIMLADRWNSTKLLQDAQMIELVEYAKKYSLKYSDMWDVKNQMQDGSLTFPTPAHVKNVEELLNMDVSDYPKCFAGKPVEHFMYQCITIQDSGRGVLKGTGVTDDLWRAVALMTWGLGNPDYVDLLRHAAKVKQNRDPSRLGVIRTPQSHAGQSAIMRSAEIGNFAGLIKSRSR